MAIIDVEFEASVFSSPAGKVFGGSQWQVHTSSDFIAPLFYDSGVVGDNGLHTVPFTSLPVADGTYFWRARYKTDEDVWGDWSSIAEFTVSNVATGPLLNTPTNVNPYEEELVILESWCGAYQFIGSVPSSLVDFGTAEFQVSMDPTFNTGVITKDFGSYGSLNAFDEPTLSFTYTELQPTNETYYWRVRYFDTFNNPTDWSTVTSFDVTDGAPT